MLLRDAFQDVRLTLTYWPLVVRVRWKLWRVPLASNSKTWREDAERELQSAPNDVTLVPFEVWRRAHAVGRAARLVPGASCLTQALALQNVLSKCGEPCSLVLGVDASQKKRAKKFEAHAWIEWRGRVLIGGPINRWKPLLTVAPNASAPSASAPSASAPSASAPSASAPSASAPSASAPSANDERAMPGKGAPPVSQIPSSP